jgi:hypothetical protein
VVGDICVLSRRLVRHSSGNEGRRRKARRRLYFASISGSSLREFFLLFFFAFFAFFCGYSGFQAREAVGGPGFGADTVVDEE